MYTKGQLLYVEIHPTKSSL